MTAIWHAAVVQHPPVFLDLEASLARAESLVAEAAAQGADLEVDTRVRRDVTFG